MLCAAGALELSAAEQDLPPFGEETACWVWHSEDGKLQVLLGLKTRFNNCQFTRFKNCLCKPACCAG